MSKATGSKAGYKFSVENRWLTMPDGVRLATTIYMPRAKRRGETFPVLLELLPYRKDDTFFLMDYPTYTYLAARGYMVVADPRQLKAVPDLIRGLPGAARKRRHLRRRLAGR